MSRAPLAILALGFAFSVTASAQLVPPVPVPPENPITPAKTILGKILFWEEQVSEDNTTACGTCHMPDAGGGDPRTLTPLNAHPGPDGVYGTADDIRGSRGIVRCGANGQFVNDGIFFPRPLVTDRKAPSAIGAMWDPETFWDGRAGPTFLDPVTQQVVIQNGGALENQSTKPPVAGEMGCISNTLTKVAQRIASARPMRVAASLTPDIQAALAQYPTYPALFNAAFGDPAVTPARMAMAIATYERTLVPDQTPWDAYTLGNTSALTAKQANGLTVFTFITNCAQCHQAPLFTDHSYHNIGVRPPAEDQGRRVVTQDVNDRGKFKTPSLRNIALKGPYFHNGSALSLTDVVDFYNRGGDFPDNRDPFVVPLALNPYQIIDLVDFLQNGLTDPRVANRLPPFDRPILHSEIAANPQILGSGTTGSGGFEPVMIASIPPVIGTARFGIGVAHAIGGGTVLMGASNAPAPSGTIILGAPIYIDLDPSRLLLFPLTLTGSPNVAGVGYQSVMVSMPDDPGLNNLTLYAQWTVLDPGAAPGFAVSAGSQFTFFAP